MMNCAYHRPSALALQTLHADGGLLNVFRFTVGNGEPSHPVENGLRAHKSASSLRVRSSGRQQQVIGHAFEHFFFAASRFSVMHSAVIAGLLGHAELCASRFHSSEVRQAIAWLERLAPRLSLYRSPPRWCLMLIHQP